MTAYYLEMANKRGLLTFGDQASEVIRITKAIQEEQGKEMVNKVIKNLDGAEDIQKHQKR